MKFEFTYTPEQERFRQEVRTWLDVNMPMDFEISSNPHDTLPDSSKYEFILAGRRKLGEKGWLAPLWPKKYGGGGLSVDEAVVLDEELAERPWTRFGIGDFGPYALTIFAPQLYALGTEEQKLRFLPPLLRGEVIGWQGYTEPDGGSDLAAVKTTAIRDGDDYMVNGEKIYAGSQFDNADYIFLVAVTDPKARRHHNLGLFWVPTSLPSIRKVRVPMMRNCHTGGWHIFFENVRVPGEYLIGGHENATKAWPVLSGTARGAEPPHRPVKGAPIRDRNHEFVVDYVRKTKCDGQLLSQDPAIREALAEVEIKLEVARLLRMRENWKALTGQGDIGYETQQVMIVARETAALQQEIYNDILGPAVLIKDPEWALFGGNMEYAQHAPLVHASAGTSHEINKMLMARWVCRAGD